MTTARKSNAQLGRSIRITPTRPVESLVDTFLPCMSTSKRVGGCDHSASGDMLSLPCWSSVPSRIQPELVRSLGGRRGVTLGAHHAMLQAKHARCVRAGGRHSGVSLTAAVSPFRSVAHAAQRRTSCAATANETAAGACTCTGCFCGADALFLRVVDDV